MKNFTDSEGNLVSEYDWSEITPLELAAFGQAGYQAIIDGDRHTVQITRDAVVTFPVLIPVNYQGSTSILNESKGTNQA